tara:strand:- start:18503 stop:18835 length:333 start_codon:yes stop_codon:yes gene_type:complete
MAVPVVNIVIEQGADYSSSFTITNPDGSPYTIFNNSAAATLKKHSASETSYAFTSEIDPDDGQILLSMSNTLTSTIPPGRYFYDIVITNINDGYKSRVIEGMAMVTPGIT